MSLEIELKLKVESHEPVRAKLIELGAVSLGRILETNRIFDDAARSMLASDRGLRVRSGHELSGLLTSATVTYKGPKHPGLLKRREEIEFSTEDPDAAVRLLEALGYIETVRFEKRRESWKLAECLVELDEIPYLGTFVEIEGPDETSIHHVREQLDLNDAAGIPGSYIALLVGYCEDHGLSFSHITF